MKSLLSENIDEEFTVCEFLTAEGFIDAINSEKYDIIFLDIILDEKDGIQIGTLINEKLPSASIIFVSVNPEYFKDVYKVTHSYFLTKELEEERFQDAVARALKQTKKDFILLHTKNGGQKILLKTVLFFESNLRHTILYFTGGETFEYNINLKDIELSLPRQTFVRTHKSFIVNMEHIQRYDRQNVFLSSGQGVPISRYYLDAAREKMACYFGGVL